MKVDFESYRGRRALITGGLGFIGSNLAHRLADLGAEVTVVDALIEGCGGNLYNVADIADRVRVNICDIGDTNSMNHLVQGQDFIFNLAGQVSHIDSMRYPFLDLEMNVRAHLSLLESCRHHNPQARIIYSSTRQPYGRPEYLPVDEKHPLRPTDVNGIHKLAAEWYHRVYHDSYGLWTTSLRLTNTLGPRQLIRHNRQGFIGWFIHQVITDAEIRLFGDGSQRRDPLYVDDAVEALLTAGLSAEARGRVYNVRGQDVVSLLEFAQALVEVAGQGRYTLAPWPPARKAIDIGDFYSTNEKITQELGWEPKVSLRLGLQRTVAFYQEHKEHYL